MRVRHVLAIAGATTAAGAGAAFAVHVPQVDPATVPTGFLATHNRIDRIPTSSLARIGKRKGMDVFVQHIRLAGNAGTGWHTHPGPVVVTVVGGSLRYDTAAGKRCRRTTYAAGRGFVDPGFGHVHQAVAGAAGADFYATYLLPRGAPTHVIPAQPVEACS
jgi:quercetin dioxygenase-like cupin family protein